MLKKVYRIEVESFDRDGAQALYTCAEKVFEIPSWKEIVKWLQEGLEPKLPEKRPPHRGAAIGLLRSVFGAETILIETEGKRRIFVNSDLSRVVIEFSPHGSIIAAGEIIHYAWRFPVDNWAAVYFMDGTSIDINEYSGPVGRNLHYAQWNYSDVELLAMAKRYDWFIYGISTNERNLGDFKSTVSV